MRFGLRHIALLGALAGSTLLGAAACAGNDSSKGGGAELGKVSQAIETGVDGGATLALINEVVVNPPGTDGVYEFVELRGTPGGSLSGFYLIGIEGDGTGAGTVDNVVDLSAHSFGSNGLLVVTAASGGHTIAPPTTVVVAPSLGSLENGTITFMLVYSPSGGFTSSDGGAVDLDPTNSGTLTLPSGAIVSDSIGWSDGGSTDKVYGGAQLALAPGAEGEAAVRFPSDDSPSSSDAWYGGQLITPTDAGVDGGSDPASTTFTTDPTNRTTNFPVDGMLTPGTLNVGTKGVDAGVGDSGDEGGLPDVVSMPDTSLPDAASEVAVDAVTPDDVATDSGPVDTGAADAPADVPADTGTDTGTDTGAADTGAGADTEPVDTGSEPADTGSVTPPRDTGTAVTDTGSDIAPPVTTTDDDGCGCRMPGSSSTNGGAAFAALALAGLIAARRRR